MPITDKLIDQLLEGCTSPSVRSVHGDMDLDVPRDREGSFEPQLVKKGEKQLHGFDDRIISLYARGMSTRDIQAHSEDVYGVEVSATCISQVTNAVMDEVTAWQNRPLDAIYPIVYLDALVVRSRASGAVQNKSVHLALGINQDGEKELLGLWMAQNEGAKFWLSVMTELKNHYWKIDYYDRNLEFHSPDPADPSVTIRVLTSVDGDTPSEITGETTSRRADLNQFQWRSYCRGLYELPVTA